jgi:hypothetical protein
MAKQIPLNHGQVALVDDEDYDALISMKWYYAEGYARRSDPDRPGGIQFMHRLILNAPTGLQVDHINGDKLDNRRSNLRLCTGSQNVRNTGKRRGTFSSVYKGVSLHKASGRWMAHIRISGRSGPLFLGYFAFEIDAANAYDHAAREHHGEFAYVNFPDEREEEKRKISALPTLAVRIKNPMNLRVVKCCGTCLHQNGYLEANHCGKHEFDVYAYHLCNDYAPHAHIQSAEEVLSDAELAAQRRAEYGG